MILRQYYRNDEVNNENISVSHDPDPTLTLTSTLAIALTLTRALTLTLTLTLTALGIFGSPPGCSLTYSNAVSVGSHDEVGKATDRRCTQP